MNVWHGILNKAASSLQYRGELGKTLRTLKRNDYMYSNKIINSSVLKTLQPE